MASAFKVGQSVAIRPWRIIFGLLQFPSAAERTRNFSRLLSGNCGEEEGAEKWDEKEIKVLRKNGKKIPF
jgi:hypothetical protein